jgi:O-antigen/teichoic acid export membrane protein
MRLAHGTFWSLVGQITARALGLLSSIFVARLLGRVSFGELGIVQSTAQMFQALAGAAMGLTAAKHVAEFRNTDLIRTGRIIALSTFVSCVIGAILGGAMAIFAPWLARNTLAAPQLTPFLRIGALLLFLGSLSGAQSGALSGFECFKEAAQVYLWSGLVGFPITIAAVYLGGLKGAVWGLVVSLGLSCAMNSYMLRRVAKRYQISLSLRSATPELSVLWRFGLPTALGGALLAPVFWACNAMLVNGPNGYAEMGVLNAANQWWSAVVFLPGMLGQVVMPILTERLSGQRHDQARSLVRALVLANLAIAVPIVLLGSIFSPLIMRSYGPQFAPSWLTLVLLLFSAGILSLQSPLMNLMVARGRMWMLLLLNLIWAAAILGFTRIFLPKGAMGVAAGRLASYIIAIVAAFVIVLCDGRGFSLIPKSGRGKPTNTDR